MNESEAIKSRNDVDIIIGTWRTENYYPCDREIATAVANIPAASIHKYFCNELDKLRKEIRSKQAAVKQTSQANKSKSSGKKEEELQSTNRIISRYIVPENIINKYKAELKPHTKTFLHQSAQCEICGQQTMGVYCYLDRANYNTYICQNCNSQLHIRSGRKLIISTPMGGQNKKY